MKIKKQLFRVYGATNSVLVCETKCAWNRYHFHLQVRKPRLPEIKYLPKSPQIWIWNTVFPDYKSYIISSPEYNTVVLLVLVTFQLYKESYRNWITFDIDPNSVIHVECVTTGMFMIGNISDTHHSADSQDWGQYDGTLYTVQPILHPHYLIVNCYFCCIL